MWVRGEDLTLSLKKMSNSPPPGKHDWSNNMKRQMKNVTNITNSPPHSVKIPTLALGRLCQSNPNPMAVPFPIGLNIDRCITEPKKKTQQTNLYLPNFRGQHIQDFFFLSLSNVKQNSTYLLKAMIPCQFHLQLQPLQMFMKYWFHYHYIN